VVVGKQRFQMKLGRIPPAIPRSPIRLLPCPPKVRFRPEADITKTA